MKILVVCIPAISHVRQLAPVARRLELAGHQIFWASNHTIKYALSTTQTLEKVLDDSLSEDLLDFPNDAIDLSSWMLEHWFIPVAEKALLPTIEFAKSIQPDLLITDCTALWGAMVADATGIPWISYSPGILLQSASRYFVLQDVYGEASPMNWSGESYVDPTLLRLERRLNRLRKTANLLPTTNLNRLSPILNLCFTSLNIELNGAGLPATAICTGSVFGQRHDIDPFEGVSCEEVEENLPIVYLSLGNVFGGQTELLQKIINAVYSINVTVVIAKNRAQNLSIPSNSTAKFIQLDQPISQQTLLKKTSLILGTGGYNTVLEGLSYGVPTLSLPQIEDQRILALRLEELSLGYPPIDKHAEPFEIKEAILKALKDQYVLKKVKQYSFEQRITNSIRKAASLIENCLKKETNIKDTDSRHLLNLPEYPNFAPRFRLFEQKEEIIFKSYSEEVVLKAPVVKEAIHWLWKKKGEKLNLFQLLDQWNGDANLSLIMSSLVNKGIMENKQITDPLEEEYSSQISVFSHVNGGNGMTHELQRGGQYQRRLQQAKVMVFGNGVTASNLLRQLAMIGIGKLNVVGEGVVNERLINKGGWFHRQDLNQPRTTALKNALTDLKPKLNFNDYNSVEILEGLSDEELPDMIILAEDAYHQEIYHKVNKFCLQKNIPWSSIRQSGWNVEIGPTIFPNQTACFKCFELRRQGGLSDQTTLNGKMIDLRSGWFHLPIGVDWLSMETLKLLTGFGEVSSTAKTIVFLVPTMNIKKHKVLRLPNCPDCKNTLAKPATTPWHPENYKNAP